LQYRFALSRASGCNASQSARLAGYQGREDDDGAQLRSQAS
jgi:phage terminase small subunit